MNCTHTFAWHAVIPPSHCPHCGACLSCGSRPTPAAPAPHPWPNPFTPPQYPQWWQQGPIYTTTVHSSTVTASGTPINT